MISNVITYLVLGVLFNFVFDLLVNVSGNEEQRFTMGERFTLTLFWPLGVGAFIFHFIKQIVSNNDK